MRSKQTTVIFKTNQCSPWNKTNNDVADDEEFKRTGASDRAASGSSGRSPESSALSGRGVGSDPGGIAFRGDFPSAGFVRFDRNAGMELADDVIVDMNFVALNR